MKKWVFMQKARLCFVLLMKKVPLCYVEKGKEAKKSHLVFPIIFCENKQHACAMKKMGATCKRLDTVLFF